VFLFLRQKQIGGFSASTD